MEVSTPFHSMPTGDQNRLAGCLNVGGVFCLQNSAECLILDEEVSLWLGVTESRIQMKILQVHNANDSFFTSAGILYNHGSYLTPILLVKYAVLQ